jgi:CubicO group peptidase (beta-lactamase class C family)
LTHSTGLPNWRFQANQQLTPAFAPGSRWQYSGEGIFLVQRVVEKITGVPIAAYMKKNVLEPLGMTSSTYAWSPALEAKAVSGHDRRARTLERSSVYYEKQNYEVLHKAGLEPESASYAEIVSAYEKRRQWRYRWPCRPTWPVSLWTTPIDYPKFITRVMADLALTPGRLSRARGSQSENLLGSGLGRGSNIPATCTLSLGRWSGLKNFTWIQPERKTALVFFTNGDHGQATILTRSANCLKKIQLR